MKPKQCPKVRSNWLKLWIGGSHLIMSDVEAEQAEVRQGIKDCLGWQVAVRRSTDGTIAIWPRYCETFEK